jgi:hypothetical protein
VGGVTTWILLRAAGIGAYIMLFLSVAWGLVSTTGALGRRISKASATTVHQFMSTCGLFLIAVHVGVVLVDSFMPFSLTDVTIPMASSYRPVAIALGILAMYASVFVIVASWLRKRIGTTWWRRTHLLAVPTSSRERMPRARSCGGPTWRRASSSSSCSSCAASRPGTGPSAQRTRRPRARRTRRRAGARRARRAR